MLLVTDLTGIWFEVSEQYKKLTEEFLKKHGAKRMASWSNYAKPARTGKISYEEALRLWFKECGIEERNIVKKFFEFENRVLKDVLIFKGKEVLEELSGKIRIIGLTDAPKPREEIVKILKTGGTDKYFHDVFSSHDIKAEKPEAFEIIRKKFGEFVFLGHEDDEILGARKLGIKTIGLRNGNADIVIQELRDLLKIFLC